METSPIRVVLAEASPLALKLLEGMLAGFPEIEIVGIARQGEEALRLVTEQKPHVLCSAAKLAGMDGLELTRQVMASYPVPILVMGARLLPGETKASDAEAVFALLEAGAVDVWFKPRTIPSPEDEHTADLVAKIKRLSRIPVISRPLKRNVVALPPGTAQVVVPVPREPRPKASGKHTLLCIGASTGGPQALLSVLSGLPRDFPVPVLCVQHISKGFLSELVDWLNRQCAITISIAIEGEAALPGHAYFPIEDTHLEIDTRGRLHLTSAAPRSGHRPSVNVTFEAAAQNQGSAAIAVLLTGMGSDGATGLKAIHDAGGATIAQSESSCVVFGMPKAAIALGAAQYIMAPAEMPRKIIALVG